MDVRGVGRSGTTLIHQVLSLIDPENLSSQSKVHSNDLRSKEVIICVRDFRDILVSRWRVQTLSRQHRHAEFNNRQMTKKEIDTILFNGHMRKQMENMDEIRKVAPKLLILHYEKFLENFVWLFDELESFLGMKINNRDEIINECNIDANLKRIVNFTNFKIIETTHQFHGHHISPQKGRSVWRDKIPNELHTYITDQLKADLIKWGYYNSSESNKKKGHSGESHHNWIEDRSKVKQKRGSYEEKQFFKRILKERNYTCEITGNVGRKLSVHHLDSVHLYPDKIFDENNVIVENLASNGQQKKSGINI